MHPSALGRITGNNKYFGVTSVRPFRITALWAPQSEKARVFDTMEAAVERLNELAPAEDKDPPNSVLGWPLLEWGQVRGC